MNNWSKIDKERQDELESEVNRNRDMSIMLDIISNKLINVTEIKMILDDVIMTLSYGFLYFDIVSRKQIIREDTLLKNKTLTMDIKKLILNRIRDIHHDVQEDKNKLLGNENG